MTPSTIPAPKPLVKSFLKTIDAFMSRQGFKSQADQARVLGIRAATLSDWRTGKRRPTAETIARVSADMTAVERYLSVPHRP
jgi:plasmid maintenance system antidote protein VapI